MKSRLIKINDHKSLILRLNKDDVSRQKCYCPEGEYIYHHVTFDNTSYLGSFYAKDGLYNEWLELKNGHILQYGMDKVQELESYHITEQDLKALRKLQLQLFKKIVNRLEHGVEHNCDTGSYYGTYMDGDMDVEPVLLAIKKFLKKCNVNKVLTCSEAEWEFRKYTEKS